MKAITMHLSRGVAVFEKEILSRQWTECTLTDLVFESWKTFLVKSQHYVVKANRTTETRGSTECPARFLVQCS